jgi:phosphate transport system substrate-binding protein
MRPVSLVFLFALLIFGACSQQDKNGKDLSTPTSGVLKVAIDESLKPVMEAEIKVFESLYTYAHIEAHYISGETAIEELVKDSVSLAITTRKLVKGETDLFAVKKLFPKEHIVAKDGIALILNKDNPDTLLSVDQLKKIISGEISDWKQINPKSKSSKLEVVFDDPNSGMVRFLNDSVQPIAKTPANFFALKSNKAVVDYVAQKPNALGLIGVSWISDHDSAANSFLKTIRVATLEGKKGTHKPYQAYIALGEYALTRSIVMITSEARMGLANGFISFVAHDKGQRIILKSGIVPTTMPVRIVEINQYEHLNLP